MLSDAHLKLMPSPALRDELTALADGDPRISKLALEPPVQLPEEALVFAAGEGDDRVYPMVGIPMSGRSGKVWMSRLPGRYGQLEREVDAIASFGINRVVCLLPAIDINDPDFYNVPGYLPAVRARFGDRLHHVDVIDYEAPGLEGPFDQCVHAIDAALAGGASVLVHCGAGCGRAGMFVACLLVLSGQQPLEAVHHIRRHRGCGPESRHQVAYVVRFAQRLAGPTGA